MSTGRSNTLLAFILGGLAGAALALLYAPDSGREIRRKFREGIEDAEDWAKDKIEDARDVIETGTEKVRHIVEEKKEDIKAAVEAGKDVVVKGKEKLLRKEGA